MRGFLFLRFLMLAILPVRNSRRGRLASRDRQLLWGAAGDISRRPVNERQLEAAACKRWPKKKKKTRLFPQAQNSQAHTHTHTPLQRQKARCVSLTHSLARTREPSPAHDIHSFPPTKEVARSVDTCGARCRNIFVCPPCLVAPLACFPSLLSSSRPPRT